MEPLSVSILDSILNFFEYISVSSLPLDEHEGRVVGTCEIVVLGHREP